MRNNSGTRKAFTIMELIILCASIAIFAMVAIPNFSILRMRAKITRSLTGLRQVGNAIRAYRSDQGAWPLFGPNSYTGYTIVVPGGPSKYIGQKLTTPVGYLDDVPIDPFNSAMDSKADWAMKNSKCGAVATIVKDARTNNQYLSWFTEMK